MILLPLIRFVEISHPLVGKQNLLEEFILELFVNIPITFRKLLLFFLKLVKMSMYSKNEAEKNEIIAIVFKMHEKR